MHASSRRIAPRLTPIAAWTLLVLTVGCQARRDGALHVTRPDLLAVSWENRFDGAVGRIEHAAGILRGADASAPASLPADSVRHCLEIAVDLRKTVNTYRKRVDELETAWTTGSPVELDDDLDELGALRERFRNRSTELPAIRDGLQTRLDATADAASQGAIPSPPPEPAVPSDEAKSSASSAVVQDVAVAARELVASVQLLESLTATFEEFVWTVHEARARADAEDPGAVVVHVRELVRLDAPGAGRHLDRYHTAWKRWMRQSIRSNDVATAAELYAFVTASPAACRPDSTQVLGELTRAVINGTTSNADLARVEGAVHDAQQSFDGGGPRPPSWPEATRRLEAAVLVSRARNAPNPNRAAFLARAAIELDPRLEDVVGRLLLDAARREGDRLIAAKRYEDAVLAFARIVRSGPIEDREYTVSRFRSRALERAIEDGGSAVRNGTPEVAIAALSQAERLDKRGNAPVERLLRRAWHARVDELGRSDPQRAIEACDKLLARFPDDHHAVAKWDHCQLLALEARLGPPDSAAARLGVSQVRRELAETAAQLRTGRGLAACDAILVRLQAVWRRHGDSSEHPDKTSLDASEAFDDTAASGDDPWLDFAGDRTLAPVPSGSTSRGGNAGPRRGERSSAATAAARRSLSERVARKGTDASSRPGETSPDRRTAPSRAGTRHAAWSAGAIMIAMLSLLVVATRKRGLLRWRWYAVGALAAGITIGLWIGVFTA